MYRAKWIVVLAVVCLLPAARAVAANDCSTLLIVSGYFSANAKVFDGCTGRFVRDLDSEAGRLRGPQAIRQGPDGLIYVASELTNRVLRYDPATLDFVDVFIEDDPATQDFDELYGMRKPTGMDFGPDGDLYVGGFESNSIVRFDGATGEPKEVVVSSGAGGLAGLDAGMGFAPDGTLYVPGYDGNHVLHFSATGELLPALDEHVNNPRVLLFDPANGRILVTAYASGEIRQYGIGGGFQKILSTAVSHPTGMAFDTDGTLLVTSDQSNKVVRLNPNNGQMIERVVRSGAGELSGATFIFVLEKQAAPMVSQADDLYWLSGLGQVDGNRIVVEDMLETSGTAFGADFDPGTVSRRRWGSVEIQFDSCTGASLAWVSSGEDSASFGSGGYAMQPLAEGINVQRCQADGFETAVAKDLSWAAGGWFGGLERSGEGLMLDVIDDRAFVTWFTYRHALP